MKAGDAPFLSFLGRSGTNLAGRVVVQTLLFVAVALVVCFPLVNTDIWWHLAAGRLIVDSGWITSDPLAADTLGRPWIDLHWLFQLAAFLLHRGGGPLALVLAKCALCALGALLLARAAGTAAADAEDRTAPSDPTAVALCALLLVAALYPVRYLALARPVVVTLVLLGAFFLVVEHFRRHRRPLVLLWLLPLQVIWANAQPLFVLGPLLVACYLAGDLLSAWLARRGVAGFRATLRRDHLRWLALALLGLAICGLLTPYGARGWTLPFRLFFRIDPLGSELFSLNVTENIPLWQLADDAPPWLVAFRWIAAPALASFLLGWQRIELGRLLLLAVLFAFALLANRNALLFCWLAAPLAALNACTLLRRWPRLRRPLPWACVAVLLLVIVGRLARLPGEGALAETAPFRVPREAVARLALLGPRGGVFNSVRYGGYLAWTLHPRHRPSIDGRLVLRSAGEFAEHLRLADDPRTFVEHARQRDLRAALLPTAMPDRYLPLVRELYHAADWRLVYTDGTQTLFLREDADPRLDPPAVDLARPEMVEAIGAELDRRYRDRPAIRARAGRHLRRLLERVGARPPASETR